MPPISKPWEDIKVAFLLRMVLITITLNVVDLLIEVTGHKTIILIIIILIANLAAWTWHAVEWRITRPNRKHLFAVLRRALILIVLMRIDLKCIDAMLLIVASIEPLITRKVLSKSAYIGCFDLLPTGNIVRLPSLIFLVHRVWLVLARTNCWFDVSSLRLGLIIIAPLSTPLLLTLVVSCLCVRSIEFAGCRCL